MDTTTKDLTAAELSAMLELKPAPRPFPIRDFAVALYGNHLDSLFRARNGVKITLRSVHGFLGRFEDVAVRNTPQKGIWLFSYFAAFSKSCEIHRSRGGEIGDNFRSAFRIYHSWMSEYAELSGSVAEAQLGVWKALEEWAKDLGL